MIKIMKLKINAKINKPVTKMKMIKLMINIFGNGR